MTSTSIPKNEDTGCIVAIRVRSFFTIRAHITGPNKDTIDLIFQHFERKVEGCVINPLLGYGVMTADDINNPNPWREPPVDPLDTGWVQGKEYIDVNFDGEGGQIKTGNLYKPTSPEGPLRAPEIQTDSNGNFYVDHPTGVSLDIYKLCAKPCCFVYANDLRKSKRNVKTIKGTYQLLGSPRDSMTRKRDDKEVVDEIKNEIDTFFKDLKSNFQGKSDVSIPENFKLHSERFTNSDKKLNFPSPKDEYTAMQEFALNYGTSVFNSQVFCDIASIPCSDCVEVEEVPQLDPTYNSISQVDRINSGESWDSVTIIRPNLG